MYDKNKFSNVAVVGLGYVGLPLCIRFCESGLKVVGLDVDQEKVDAINAGKSYIQHIGSVNYQKLGQWAKIIVDTRNAMSEVTNLSAQIYPA